MKSTKYSSNNYTDTFQHIGLCPGSHKPITQIVTIDDGTGKLYEYELVKELEYKEYYITPNFNTNPIKPSITEDTSIIPNIIDSFDVVETNGIDYDFNEDGKQENKQENETIKQVLSIPREQTIKQEVKYFTGWEIKTDYIEKVIEKTNIAPEACNKEDRSCFTVPTVLYTSCSTDQEDNPQNLTINWLLYLDKNSTIEITYDDQGDEIRTVISDEENRDWEIQTSKENNPVFSWTFNNEGYYKLVEEVIDTDGSSNEAVREYPIVFKKCSNIETSQQTIHASGIIEVEENVWQLCAIPMSTGYWDKDKHKIIKNSLIKSTVKNVIIDQIEDVYNKPAKDIIKVINGYTGDNNQFRNYVPGFTKDSSKHNFQLVYQDEDMDVPDGVTKFEVSGFWIKAKNMNFEIKWGIVS